MLGSSTLILAYLDIVVTQTYYELYWVSKMSPPKGAYHGQ